MPCDADRPWPRRPSVTCLGDPVLDVIARVTPGDLARLGMAPGGCATLDPAALRPVLALSAASSHEYVGGSAANVARGLAQLLGGGVRFCGAVGNDDSGWRFRDRLQEQGVDVALAVCPDPSLPTARCGCLVTPDGQRTMRTCLGAAGGLTSLDHLPTRWLGHDATHLHVEGYALYRPALLLGALREAKARGLTTSIDLASFEVVRTCVGALGEALGGGLVDVVFANEDEARALRDVLEPGGPWGHMRGRPAESRPAEGVESHVQVDSLSATSTRACAGERVAVAPRDSLGTEGDDSAGTVPGSGEVTGEEEEDAASTGEQPWEGWAVREAMEAVLATGGVRVCVVSLGRRGCVARGTDGSWGLSPACHVPVVDTVGAGDGFCAGFLSVLLRGGSLQQCAVAGCMVGREAVSVAGAQIATATWQTLAEQMQGMVAARCQAVCD